MRSNIKRAKKFVDAAEGKFRKGRLPEHLFVAEIAPVSMAISLHDRLHQLFEGAVKTGATQPCFVLLNVATGVLLRRLDEAHLMREGKYPAGEDIQKQMMNARISTALSLYNDVVSKLGDVPQKLGMPFSAPSLPSARE